MSRWRHITEQRKARYNQGQQPLKNTPISKDRIEAQTRQKPRTLPKTSSPLLTHGGLNGHSREMFGGEDVPPPSEPVVVIREPARDMVEGEPAEAGDMVSKERRSRISNTAPKPSYSTQTPEPAG